MTRPVLSLFGRRKSAEPVKVDTLSEVIIAILDNASVVLRPGTGDDAWDDKAIVQFGPGTGFVWSAEAGARAVRDAFSELSDAAVQKAVRRLASLVGARRRQFAETLAAAQYDKGDRFAARSGPWLNRY